jgi:hypothetical protein
MSRFDRNWTLQLQTDKENFCAAFYKVVSKETGKLVLRNIDLGNTVGRDFFGILRNETFTIWKRKGLFDLNSTGLFLDGKMVEGKNYLVLELRILNNLAFNYIRIFIISIPLTAVIFLLLTRSVSLIKPIPGNIFTMYSFITITILFMLVYWLQLKDIYKYLDKLSSSYNGVLKKIGSYAKSK